MLTFEAKSTKKRPASFLAPSPSRAICVDSETSNLKIGW